MMNCADKIQTNLCLYWYISKYTKATFRGAYFNFKVIHLKKFAELHGTSYVYNDSDVSALFCKHAFGWKSIVDEIKLYEWIKIWIFSTCLYLHCYVQQTLCVKFFVNSLAHNTEQ